MPPRPRPLPPALGSTFARADALAAGATPRRLRAKDLETPFRGVRMVRVTPDDDDDDDENTVERAGSTSDDAVPGGRDDDRPLARDRSTRRRVRRLAQAYLMVMAPGAFFAGRTAAVLHRLPLEHGDQLEVGVVAPRRAPRRNGIRGRKIAAHLVHVTSSGGMPVASPASTWAMLADELTVRELVVLGDAIVRIPRDRWGRSLRALATLAQLRAAADAGRRAGVDRLRGALRLIRVGSSSPLETEFRLDAQSAGLPDAELDVEIRDGAGRLLGISEFVYPAYRVIVEVEGDHHRTRRSQWNRDIDKYAAYVAAGWEVVRLTSAHIRGHEPRAVAIVRATLLRRGWQP